MQLNKISLRELYSYKGEIVREKRPLYNSTRRDLGWADTFPGQLILLYFSPNNY